MLQGVEGRDAHGPPGAALDAATDILTAREPLDGGANLGYEAGEFGVLGGVPGAVRNAEIHRRPPSGLLRSGGRVKVYATYAGFETRCKDARSRCGGGCPDPSRIAVCRLRLPADRAPLSCFGAESSEEHDKLQLE